MQSAAKLRPLFLIGRSGQLLHLLLLEAITTIVIAIECLVFQFLCPVCDHHSFSANGVRLVVLLAQRYGTRAVAVI